MIPSERRRVRERAGGWLPVMVVIFSLVLVGVVVGKIPPDRWWVEAGVVFFLGTSLFIGGSWVTGRKRWGLILVMLVMGVLLMRRFEILDWISLGMLLVILGLIGIVN